MAKKQYLLIYGISLIFYFAVSQLQKTPGYMDASYYFTMGQQLATGKGAAEPYLWNYLNSPQQIPAPAFTYWMPLSAFLAAAGMKILQSTAFQAARILFILLAASIPVLTAILTSKITNKKYFIVLAAIFSLFSGSYLPFLTITETFVPFFVLGGIYILLVWQLFESNSKKISKYLLRFMIGLVAGLLHLTRADGILWLFGGFLALWLSNRGKEKREINAKTEILNLVGFFAGYLLVMAGWLIRNSILFGSPFASGSSLAIWFTNYDDLFIYPAALLNFQHLASSGFTEIVRVRGMAGLSNIENLVAVVGDIVLTPFMIVGFWKSRKKKLTQFILLMTSLLFCLMTFVFPFAGYRGGFFHSMSAFQIFFWAMAVCGIDFIIPWTIKKLKWVENKSRNLFAILLVISVAILSAIGLIQKIQPPGQPDSTWDGEYAAFLRIDQYLMQMSENDNFSVMVNDSPSYYGATSRTAIQLSSGQSNSVIELMQKFNIDYLLVDQNVPARLETLYNSPGDDFGLKYIGKFEDTFIYGQE